jgi:predicted TIM-barrel fold metal-dependent hydrolase
VVAALPLAMSYVRPDVVLWASDYPHERDQRDFSGDIPALLERSDISDEVKRQIWYDNPTRFYRLDRLPAAAGVVRAALAAT